MSDYPRFTAAQEFGDVLQCRYRYMLGSEDYFNPHCHEFYELVLTVSGTVTHWVNNTTTVLPEGTLMFIRPDDTHGFVYDTPQNSDAVYINLAFTAAVARDLFHYLSPAFPSHELLHAPLPPTVLLPRTEKERLIAAIGALNALNWKDTDAWELRMRVVLADVFVRAFSRPPERAARDLPVWLSALLTEMEQPEHFIAGCEEMTRLSGRSYEHLSRSLKKHLGMTPTEYINALRINYASNLLLNTNRPVIDICFTCGFQSLSNFYKAFSRACQLSPTAFRKAHKLEH